MTALFSRSDRSVLGRWWWTVDRWTLGGIAVLLTLGVFLIQAASPAGAAHLGHGGFYFVERHLMQLLIGVMRVGVVRLLSGTFSGRQGSQRQEGH